MPDFLLRRRLGHLRALGKRKLGKFARLGASATSPKRMRIHKRLIDIAGDERTLRQVMRVKVPDTVQVKISLE